MTPLIASILLIALGAWLALCIHDRHAALVAFVALLPTYLIRFQVPVPGTGFALPTTLLELLFLVLCATWLCTDGLHADAWRPLRAWIVPITLFLVAATIAVAVAPETLAALGLWRAYAIEPVAMFVMCADIVARKKSGAPILAALGAVIAVVGAYAVYQKATGYGIPNPLWAAEETRRVTAFYGFPNAIALFAAPVAVLMTAWATSLLERRAYAAAIGAAVSALLGAVGIFFAVSEGGAIGLLAGLGMYGLLHVRLRPWALGALIAACAAVVFVPQLRDYASLLVSLRDDSGYVRRYIWAETGAMLADHPVFGTGLSGYPERIMPYHDATWIERFQYPHNVVLNFWTEIGLLGLLAFGWIVTKFFLIAEKISRAKDVRWIAHALIAAMTAMLVHGLVDVPYFKNDLAMLFWIIVGLAEALRRLHGAEPSPVAKIKRKVVESWPWKLA